MKLLVFLAAAVAIINVTSGKKLRLITGLNGNVVGVAGGNPGLVVGGVNPFLTGGQAFIGQPQLQVFPGVGVPQFAMQPGMVPASPFGFPNAAPQFPQQQFPQQQFPQQQPPQQQQQQPQQPQQPFPFSPANGGLPYYGFPQAQPGLFPPQQQVAGVNPETQQQSPPQTPVRRFRRMIRRLQRINIAPAHENCASAAPHTTASPTSEAPSV
ncbi:secretory calcium-binding phosphoprotein 9 [Engraulis encrasicolus]|uniref:secretory calcium-binding phosphoprotein 9 n=1 Tax=Engraulis encrasicolus TaxID=184585 RepID=UPI002FD4A390